jgi:polyhydroxyalkanoate synthesis repressor PhaR
MAASIPVPAIMALEPSETTGYAAFVHASGKVAIMTDTSGAETPPIVIKKYANRRLYNTATSSYVTLDDLSRMVKARTDFVVYDAKTGEDITRAVLTQIIVEEEGKGGQNLLPISFLRQLIGLYGDSMQWLVPRYLEHAMSSFGRNQEQMRKSLQDAFGGLFPFGSLEQMGKQNLALFEQTMKMFSPFGQTTAADKTQPEEKPKDTPPSEAALSELQKQINELQQQMQAYGKKEKGED